MAEGQRFYGWANRSTWVTFLWLTADEETYNYARKLAQAGLKEFRDWGRSYVRNHPQIAEDVKPRREVDWEQVLNAIRIG